MKVAFVSFAFGEYSIRLASALSRHAEIGLWVTEWQSAPHRDRLAAEVAFHPFPKPRMRHIRLQIPLMTRLVRELIRFGPDVIHLQQGYLWFNPVLPLLRRFPLVVTVHDPTPHVGDRLGQKTPQTVARIAYRRASQVVVHNPEMREAMAALGIARERVNVVPTVVRGDELAPPIAEDDRMVLFYGRIWEYKGLEYLIRAQPLISRAVPDARIVIAGEGEDFERYRRMMADPDRFEVHNEYVSQEKQSELFNRAALVVLPYIDATQSGVVPTAYNHRKPVVSTTVGGLPSMVEDGQTGLLVPPCNEMALAEAVITLLSDSALRQQMGANGKQRAEDEFSAASVAEKTLRVYEKALRISRT